MWHYLWFTNEENGTKVTSLVSLSKLSGENSIAKTSYFQCNPMIKIAVVIILRLLVRSIYVTVKYYYLVIAWDCSGSINQLESTNRQDNGECGSIISSDDL